MKTKLKDEILTIAKDILHRHIRDPDVGEGALLEALMKIRTLIESEIRPGDVVMYNNGEGFVTFFVATKKEENYWWNEEDGHQWCADKSQKCPPEIEPKIRELLDGTKKDN